MLKWVRGEPLSQDHWLDMFRLLGLPKGTTLEKLTFGDIISVADAIVINAAAIKVMLDISNGKKSNLVCHNFNNLKT